MRIAYDHQIFGWQEYGGISRYLFEIANRISDIPEHEISIISPVFVNRYLKEANGALHVTGIHVPRLPKTGRIYRALNAILAKPLIKRFGPEIVHETYYSSRRIAPRGAKVVLTVHDMIHEKYPECFSSYDPTRHEKAEAVRRADHIICVSESTKRDLMEILNIEASKISVINHGCSLPLAADKDSLNSLIDQPFLLYVGLRTGYKNFSGLLEAYASSHALMQSFQLICFGGGRFTSGEESAFRHLGIADGKVLHMSGGDDILAALYHSAALFVYPSKYEGFGIPPLEAMLQGCPVASSNTSSLPEVVGDAAEVFDPNDIGQILEAIENVVGNTAMTRELIDKGYQRVSRFSWEKCAAETLKVYEALA